MSSVMSAMMLGSATASRGAIRMLGSCKSRSLAAHYPRVRRTPRLVRQLASHQAVTAHLVETSDLDKEYVLHGLPALASLKASLNTAEPTPASSVLIGAIDAVLDQYWERCPTATSVMNYLAREQPDETIYFDHFAFRTFAVEGLGISSLSRSLMDLGYQEQPDRLTFEAKKLRARWYAPPDTLSGGAPLDYPLPRIFVSELKVEELSSRAQGIIRKYTSPLATQGAAKHGLLASACNCLPWATPTVADWEALAEESEYAAWVLVNGYALNHTTISVHRLGLATQTIKAWNEMVKSHGIVLNSSGGEEKVSPDGGLRQSSTLSDTVNFSFSCGATKPVPGPYIEFAERRILPAYQGLPLDEIREHHRREGFETASADKIFESTSGVQS